MLDHLTASTISTTNTSQINVQSSTSQIAPDFNSILQELKSVGQAHQPLQGQIINMKQEELHTNSNNTGKKEDEEPTIWNRKEGSRVINLPSLCF